MRTGSLFYGCSAVSDVAISDQMYVLILLFKKMAICVCMYGNMVKVRFEFSIIIKFCTFIWPLSENRLSYTGEICSV